MTERAAIILVLATAIVAQSGAPAGADQPDIQDGQAQFKQICATCHTNEPAKNRIGPSLFGLIGRRSGSAPGFNYSDAMKSAGIVWDEQTLDKYLADPKAFVPGNKMPYLGVKKAETRHDIISYLRTLR